MCHPFLIGTFTWVLRPKLVNPPLMVLRPKPPNPLASSYSIRIPCHSTRVTAVLDRPATKSSEPRSTCTSSVLTRSTLSLSSTLALVDISDVSHRDWSPASWSLGPSLTSALHCSRSIGMARLYLTFFSLSTTASELHTCTTQAKRHVAHIAFAMGLVTTQPTLWITLTIIHHKTNHKDTF
jgi:hypothetical protein